jgi:putative DNA methylase
MLGDAGLPMIMDFAEINPLADSSGGWLSALDYVCAALHSFAQIPDAATVVRGSALSTPWEDESFDAVVTDPPYYDSRSYSNLSDHFYVWHKRAVGHLYPEHFASQLTPKKGEAIAAPYRHGGDRGKADTAYETMMLKAFQEARRLLKPGAPMVCVYAHKTTAGWSTLINAMRVAGFSVAEAWPVEMERKVRQNALETAALASSILLVARRREGADTGSYEKIVRPELEAIVSERVETLWAPSSDAAGIQGADLVVAAVGAGLRAFTRFARVELENGEEVPAERFLAEVETVVLESILHRLSKEVGGNGGRHSLAGVDPATRFYILWRYTYRWSELDAGEAIVFANGTHVELDGHGALTYGSRALVEKKKDKYRLRDYAERGEDEKLGASGESGEPTLIDILHRTLWLMERRPGLLPEFLREARPNREQMRLVTHALAGPALRGGELSDVSPSSELSALARLAANWRNLVEEAAMTPAERDERRTGQKHLDFGKEGRK